MHRMVTKLSTGAGLFPVTRVDRDETPQIDSTGWAVSCPILSVPDRQIREHNPTPSAGLAIRLKTQTRLRTFIGSMTLAATALTLAAALFPAQAANGPLAVSQTSAEKRLNNLVSELLEVSPASQSGESFTFATSRDGWVFVSSTCNGTGTVHVILDSAPDPLIAHDGESVREAMRYVTKGEHTLQVEAKRAISVDKLVVKGIPELIHCGLGFNPEIKSYGLYDMEFLRPDVLPNVTTLIVPGNIQLSRSVVDDWHRQGKWFVAEVGINSRAKTAEDHFDYWSGLYDKEPFLGGIIINEFIVNRPVSE